MERGGAGSHLVVLSAARYCGVIPVGTSWCPVVLNCAAWFLMARSCPGGARCSRMVLSGGWWCEKVWVRADVGGVFFEGVRCC